MFTVQEIRDEYPAPCTVGRRLDAENTYCVGGAFCLYVYSHKMAPTYPHEEPFEPWPFPGPTTVKDYLFVMNPKLTLEKSYTFAASILWANDQGNFENAWDILATALAWTPTEEK